MESDADSESRSRRYFINQCMMVAMSLPVIFFRCVTGQNDPLIRICPFYTAITIPNPECFICFRKVFHSDQTLFTQRSE
jgi:hypothetical protein